MRLEENERLLGAFGHVSRVRGEPVLKTIGFLKNDCWYGETPKDEDVTPTEPTWVQRIKTIDHWDRFATLKK